MESNWQETDEELVSKYLDGDESAFVEIVNRYLKPIYNFTYRLCGNVCEAEEITQESFLKIWKNLQKFKKGEKFKTWAFTISRNATIDKLRKKKSFVFSDFDSEDGDSYIEDSLVDSELLPDELFEKAEGQKNVENILSCLPENYREVMILRYNEDMTFEEISSVLKRTLNTVRSQHRRALIILKDKLKMHQNR